MLWLKPIVYWGKKSVFCQKIPRCFLHNMVKHENHILPFKTDNYIIKKENMQMNWTLENACTCLFFVCFFRGLRSFWVFGDLWIVFCLHV